ncbi:hypothetical protein N0V85_005527 [Neurospora sp. IMI 360204]|nr:hypothetical protein N0V85_005527 [Neurospora sp. IMI 360204]
MSTQANGAAAPDHPVAQDVAPDLVAHSSPDAIMTDADQDASTPMGLRSPPESDKAMNPDEASDSELSDLDDDVADKLDQDLTFDLDLGSDPLPDSKTEHQHPEPSVSHDHEPAATAATAATGKSTQVKEEQEGERNEATSHSQQPETGAASATTPMSPSEDIGDILPDRFENNVPVFKPTMKQFQDFKLFMEKVDKYGMKSGIIKIVPPEEWKSALPPRDELVKQVRVREPIKQEIMGQNGTYRQVNILHQRSYNLPQWRQLCEQSEHQPPARRGERRANAEKNKPAARSRAAAAANATTSTKTAATTKGKRKGRLTRGSAKAAADETDDPPITPVSPPPEDQDKPLESIEEEDIKDEACEEEESTPRVGRMGFSRQSKPKMQSTSARRKYIRREGSAMIDEAAFKNWDYRMDVSEFTPERCEELERIYWKTLTYAPPLYGADLPGTLFDESTENWNLNKLPNLLDVLGTKVPGVNTAYLYLGMWKATFAWHLEDVDLYSINFLHFGAPKQWYSISQADARRFEAAMKNIWPTDAKACDQFLRHKSFLISPSHLKQHYGITVNKVVSYPGEFVVTYPYGYHSGYNLGYNCAEAVNFALDSWLPMGKIAKKCQCAQAQDSVWVDVYEIERKLRGESTEYEVTEDEDEEKEEDSEDSDQDTGLPSPPSGLDQRGGKRVRAAGQKRKRGADNKGTQTKAKRTRYRLKAPVEPPCCLCPNDIPGAEIMPTDDGRKAHRMCALYLPETYIETVDNQEIIANVAGIDKARLELKCLYCRSKKGACFQCSQKKCPRAYHATCAAAAGVFVEEGDVPVIGEDGTEYKEQAFEFSCRFHRVKRDRKTEGTILEDDPVVRKTAEALKKNDICQIQYYQGNIFAGVVVENLHEEETLLLDVIPSGDRIQVEWKWLLVADPSEYRLPKASPNAIPMPTSKKAKQEINAKRPVEEIPRKGDEFSTGFVWAEFHTGEPDKNKEQVKIDLEKENQVWHYLGPTSTEARAQYTENPSRKQHNSKSNFLDTIPKLPPAYPVQVASAPSKSFSATYPAQQQTFTASPVSSGASSFSFAPKQDKPYVYKPRKPVQPQTQFNVQYTSHMFMPSPPLPSPSYMPQQNHPLYQAQLRPNVPQTVHPSQVFSPQPMQFDAQRRPSQPIQPYPQQQMSPPHFAQHQMPQQMPQHQFQPQQQQQHFQHFQPPQQPHYQQQPQQQQHRHYSLQNYPQTPVPLPPQAFQFQQQTPVPLPQQVQPQPPQQQQQIQQVQTQPPQQQQQQVQQIQQTPVPVPQVPLQPQQSAQSSPQQQQQQPQDEEAHQPLPPADQEAQPPSPPQPLKKPKPFKVYKVSQFRKLKLPEKRPGAKKDLPEAFASSRFSFAGIDRIHDLAGIVWPPESPISGREVQFRRRVWSPLSDEGIMPAPMTSSLLKCLDDDLRVSTKYEFFQVYNNRDPLKHHSPYKQAVTELDETTGKKKLVHADFANDYGENFTEFMKKAREALTRKDVSEPGSRPTTSQTHSRDASSASAQPNDSQLQQNSFTGQPAQQPRVQPQYTYNQHEAGFGAPSSSSPFSSHSVPGPVMFGPTFGQQSGSHQDMRQQYQGPWQQQYQNQGSHDIWMGSPQMVGSPQPHMFSPSPAQQGHHHHLPQQQQQAQNQQPQPQQPTKPQFTKQSHSPIPLPPYVQKMNQVKPSPLSQPPQTNNQQGSQGASSQPQAQKRRQRKSAQQASGQTISPTQLGVGSSTQGQVKQAQQISNNPWTNANNVNLQFPSPLNASSQQAAPATPAAPAQAQSQNASDNAPAEADAGAEQESGGEAQDDENCYFNEAQGLQTPPLQQQSLSSTDVSPDQNYFPLSAPPPTPLTGIQNRGGFAFGSSFGVGFNAASTFNVAALSGGIAGLGALGTLGGLLGGLESGASGNGTSSGRARGLSRSGDNVFMGSTSAIEDGEGELGCGMGGHGSRGGQGGGSGGAVALSRQDVLDKILSNLHRLGTD